MTARADPAVSSLRALLRRTHLGFAFSAVALVGAVLALPALATLRLYAEHDLHLIGRAIGYTVEAAVVFKDGDAALQELRAIVATEDIAEVVVTLRNGVELARWDPPPGTWQAGVGRAIARLLSDGPARVPIMHDGVPAGMVELRGGARMLLPFLAYGALGILLCQAMVAAGAIYLSGRIQRRIVEPLGTLAALTAVVARNRAFGERVPATPIKELNELGQTFNGLLEELESWQAFITGENERLSHQATHDSLTGLQNRAVFEGRLSRALGDAKQAGTTVALLLIDCDRFKSINDNHGHSAGDAVLVTIAARLRSQVRDSDLVVRLGGDEFAILIAPGPPEPILSTLVETLGSAMQLPMPLPAGGMIVAAISVGLAIYPTDAANAAALLHQADIEMYRAKHRRKTG